MEGLVVFLIRLKFILKKTHFRAKDGRELRRKVVRTRPRLKTEGGS